MQVERYTFYISIFSDIELVPNSLLFWHEWCKWQLRILSIYYYIYYSVISKFEKVFLQIYLQTCHRVGQPLYVYFSCEKN